MVCFILAAGDETLLESVFIHSLLLCSLLLSCNFYAQTDEVICKLAFFSRQLVRLIED